jgi:uncharacterized protein
MIGTIRKRSPGAAAGIILAGLILLLACGPAAAEPALWLAKGPKAMIYLFGTIHVLKKDAAWESRGIAKALALSQELWLEIPNPGDTTDARTLTQQLGFDPQHPLSAKLPAPLLTHLDAAAKAVGMKEGEKTLEPMRPWLASVALEDALLIHAGYDPDSGVEPQLRRQAVTAGKPVRGFESMAQQLHFFADMAPGLELQLLQQTLRDFDQGRQEIDALVDAWMSGDDDGITRTIVDEVRQPFPALYRTLFVERNEAWAAAIAQMLRGSGVTFVAVGAGHLAGPDSVQAMLERRGIEVERVNSAN